MVRIRKGFRKFPEPQRHAAYPAEILDLTVAVHQLFYLSRQPPYALIHLPLILRRQKVRPAVNAPLKAVRILCLINHLFQLLTDLYKKSGLLSLPGPAKYLKKHHTVHRSGQVHPVLLSRLNGLRHGKLPRHKLREEFMLFMLRVFPHFLGIPHQKLLLPPLLPDEPAHPAQGIQKLRRAHRL